MGGRTSGLGRCRCRLLTTSLHHHEAYAREQVQVYNIAKYIRLAHDFEFPTLGNQTPSMCRSNRTGDEIRRASL